jgi:hypothetical protein
MRFIALFATIATLSIGFRCGHAEAMPIAPSALDAADAGPALLERVVNVCGVNGCAPIHVRRVQKPPPDFVRRAAPLVFPIASAPRSPPANK